MELRELLRLRRAPGPWYFVRRTDFAPSESAFDATMQKIGA